MKFLVKRGLGVSVTPVSSETNQGNGRYDWEKGMFARNSLLVERDGELNGTEQKRVPEPRTTLEKLSGREAKRIFKSRD